MKIIRFDSVGGASGDMILGALIGLGADADVLNRELASLIPDEKFRIIAAPKESHGINGITARVEIDEPPHSPHHGHDHHHDHGGRSFADIRQLIERSGLTDTVKAMSIKVFAALAAAEGKIHNMTPDKVHFHEVGAVDSIVDITGCCLALEMLGVQGISVSPLPSGQGYFQMPSRHLSDSGSRHRRTDEKPEIRLDGRTLRTGDADRGRAAFSLAACGSSGRQQADRCGQQFRP